MELPEDVESTELFLAQQMFAIRASAFEAAGNFRRLINEM